MLWTIWIHSTILFPFLRLLRQASTTKILKLNPLAFGTHLVSHSPSPTDPNSLASAQTQLFRWTSVTNTWSIFTWAAVQFFLYKLCTYYAAPISYLHSEVSSPEAVPTLCTTVIQLCSVKPLTPQFVLFSLLKLVLAHILKEGPRLCRLGRFWTRLLSERQPFKR